jgi:hypothetical protein
MTLTMEQFQKDAQPWLARLKESRESLLLVFGEEVHEWRLACPITTEMAMRDLENLLPKRDNVVGDPGGMQVGVGSLVTSVEDRTAGFRARLVVPGV